MDKTTFINKVIGIPWENRKSDFNSTDCFGLVYLYFMHVHNKEIPLPPGYYNKKPFEYCWEGYVDKDNWEPINNPIDGSVAFMSYDKDVPAHIGIVINRTQVLHCTGNIEKPGTVKIQSIRSIKKYYGQVKFFKRKSTDETS